MATFTERDGTTILTGATDPEFDPLFITQINGDPALINQPISLSIGGSVTIASNGVTTFDDTGFTWPTPGTSVADGVIAEVSDGSNLVSVAVNLEIHAPV